MIPEVLLDHAALLSALKAHAPAKPEPKLPWHITPRERQACFALSDWSVARHDNKWIALQLGVTEGSVKIYLHNLSRKTGLDRVGLALLGLALRSMDQNLPRCA
jgi:DNA-binding CsgD family transcriptional regulator